LRLPARRTLIFDEFTSRQYLLLLYHWSDRPSGLPGCNITDAAGSGFVMNGGGWSNEGRPPATTFSETLSGFISLTFNSAVSNVDLDVINGTSQDHFTVTAV